MNWAQLVAVALGSAVLASVLSGAVTLHVAKQQRDHDRERDREAVRRAIYASYLLFAERLPMRWERMLADLSSFTEAIDTLIEERREIEVPLRLAASAEVNKLMLSKAEPAFEAFMEHVVANGPKHDHPSLAELEPLVADASRLHWRPFVNELAALMSRQLGGA